VTTDRHREKPLSLRLGAERQRLETFARDTGQPVRRVIADAVKAWLDKHAAKTGSTMPTTRQATVLATLASATGSGKRTAKDMHVRSDVLWRMQEAGWVARTLHQEWYIRDAGQAALERWRNRNVQLTTDRIAGAGVESASAGARAGERA
jgi:hypothetical protein